MTSPGRPPQVPAEAWWLPKDREWELGARDAQGRLEGPVRYWRPDGTLCCVCERVADTPHGHSTRYHEGGEVSQTCTFVNGLIHGLRVFLATDGPTTERMHASGISGSVRRIEMDYEHGDLVAQRYFAADGTALCRDGKPLPPRPASVSPQATFLGAIWVSGRWTEQGKRNGLLRYWSREGVLIEETEWREDRGEGVHRAHDATGELREEVTYHEGLREGVGRAFRPEGTLAREATFSRGEYHGVLRDYDETGTRVLREVHFEHGVRQSPPALPKAPPPSLEEEVSAPASDWRSRLTGPEPVSLDLSRLGLEHLPEDVGAFRQLRELALDHNRLRRLPAWLVELEALEWLSLAGNRFLLLRRARSVLFYLKQLRPLPIADRRMRFCLFQGDVEQALAQNDLSALRGALDDRDPCVRAHAELALAQARPSPLSPGRRVFVVGTPRQRSPEALRRELEEAGLTVVEHPEDAQVLLVAQRPSGFVSDPRPLAVEADLPAPPVDIQELTRLYVDAEAHDHPGERRRARQRLHQLAPPALWAFLRGATAWLDTRDNRQLAVRVPLLVRTGFFDRNTLVERMFQYGRRGLSLVLEDGGPRARAALASCLSARKLNLGHQGLRTLPPEIGDFPDLAQLDVGFNPLTALPEEVGELFSLMVLELQYTRLTALPMGLARLVQLRRLRAEALPLAAFPEVVTGLTGLTHLNLGRCRLKEIPPTLGRLTRLKELYLNHNGLTTLPGSLAALRQLTFLHLSGNPFVELPPVLFELEGLTDLWLEQCGLRVLSPRIERLVKLERLCIWYNALESLPVEALARLPRLKELRIRENALSDAQQEALRAALPHCTLY